MRIGTYNVLVPRDDKPNKAQESWESRKAAVVETIDSSFDLVGLQEVSSWPPHGQALYLVEELEARGWTGYYPWDDHRFFSDEFHVRVPIFYRPELFEILESGQLLLSSWTEEELAVVPTLENRYASFLKLKTAEGGVLWFYTLHLQHVTATATPPQIELSRLKQEEGQRVVADHILRQRAPEDSVAVAGDFNTTETADSLRDIAGLANISELAESLENWSFDSFHDWVHPKRGEHIDHVLYAGSGSVLEASIVMSNSSDHHPVQAIVQL